ncbi:MAG TPA: diguanylate cyclase [Pyrinomonadaceae bacterium]|nr:diguanylate cyclase [Pyrinomonadaceae bacterium]
MTRHTTSHPARQFLQTELPLAQFAGGRVELLPTLSLATSLRKGLADWWLTNQLWIWWGLLVLPLGFELIFDTFHLPYLILAPLSLFATYLIYRNAHQRLQSKTEEVEALSQLHLATAEALATAIDAKDQTTHCHVRRVQIYAAGMGEVFELPPEEIAALKAGALLHDIGKLAVPPHILNKPGPLTPAEFEKMKIHTVVGAQILGRVDFPYPVIPIIRHHHEQWDGRGYPDKLRGEQIPITARIISVVDCFDSVREDRPFRRSMTTDEAIALLRRGAGIHFDPVVVDQFIKHLPRFEAEIVRLGLQHQPVSHLVDPPIQLSTIDMAQTRERGSYIAYDQIKKAHREVYALYEIARTFGTSLDVEHTLEILVDKVGHVVPFDTCIVYLYDESKGYATARHVVGKNAQKLAGRAIAPGDGVTGFALANRRHINQLHPSLDFTDINPEAGIKYRSMAALPLFKDDVLLGALSVYSSELEQYSDDHMRLLETVTRLASDALGNAIQHAEAESNALTDPLTSLPNARYLALRFEEEAARARRTDRSFQVVMMDLDEFKDVNDTYGHKVGDKMLREVGHIIHSQLREYDFLARYGGDEFVALVQEVVGAQVEELCARIESAVSKFSLSVGKNRFASVGISVGTATFGVNGETLDQLVIQADREMYRTKSSHRSARINTEQAVLIG